MTIAVFLGHSAITQASQITYLGLRSLQHRGQEASGIVTCEHDVQTGKHRMHSHKEFGLVNDVFRDDTLITQVLRGESAIGHNRYSTSGSANNRNNIQPFLVNYRNGNIAICHNGNLTNFSAIRARLQREGTIFQSTSDTEIILHLIARSRESNQVRQIIDALQQVEGGEGLRRVFAQLPDPYWEDEKPA